MSVLGFFSLEQLTADALIYTRENIEQANGSTFLLAWWAIISSIDHSESTWLVFTYFCGLMFSYHAYII